ncbi:hypothetical protein LEMLEM_LOCUS18530 [Lemmus lemmus]
MNTPGAFSQLANKTHSKTSLCLESQEPSPDSGRIRFLTASEILSMRDVHRRAVAHYCPAIGCQSELYLAVVVIWKRRVGRFMTNTR